MVTMDEVERYITEAKQAGCPPDQVKRFISGGYVAQPKQLEFHSAARSCDIPGGPHMIGMGGARGPGKTHAIMAQVGLDDCQRYPGLKFLFLRNIQKAAQESFEDVTRRTLWGVDYKLIEGKVTFPNSSKIIVGGYKDDRDIEKYLGIEYDGIVIEECTQLTETKYDMLHGSRRTTIPGWRVRTYLSTNPGSVGHLWFKNRFVMPARNNQETDTRFIFATYKDNKFLSPDYIDYLEGLKGDLYRMWTMGDWDVFQGQALSLWRYDRHVITPAEMPDNWMSFPKWRAVDWGTAAPFCCGWFCKDPDTSRIIMYREAYQAGLTDRQQARLIAELTPDDEQITITYADPALWTVHNKNDVTFTTADEYKAEGILLTKATNDRLAGKRTIDRLMADLPDGRPGLQFLSSCVNTIRTLPALPYDNVRVEDVDTDAEDHAYDVVRYALTNIMRHAEKKEKQVEKRNSYKSRNVSAYL